MLWPWQNKLMSDLQGQGAHALAMFQPSICARF
jgi:hypothetical protein